MIEFALAIHGGTGGFPHKPTPGGAVVGNLTSTSFDACPAVSPVPLYPFSAAYRHGDEVGAPEQENAAGGDPTGNPVLVPPDALTSMSITPAVQAASAAPCAI